MYTDAGFAAKVEWEGGVVEALEYGLRVTDLVNPRSEVGRLWAELEWHWKDVSDLVNRINRALEDAVEAELDA